MTFNVDSQLTIDVYDRIKANGGKITVFKQLELTKFPKRKKLLALPKDELPPDEPEEDWFDHGLVSQMYGDYNWEDGWNHAECSLEKDPIPIIVNHGHIAGAGMIHVWLKDPGGNTIPLEARLEDFHFAGWTSFGLDTNIQLGFKKVYLYKVDKELCIKELLNKKPDKLADIWHARRPPRPGQIFAIDPAKPMTATEIQAMNRAAADFQFNNAQFQQQLLAQQQAAMQSISPLTQALGGALGGGGKQDQSHFHFTHIDTGGSPKKRYITDLLGRIKRVCTSRRSDKPDNSQT